MAPKSSKQLEMVAAALKQRTAEADPVEPPAPKRPKRTPKVSVADQSPADTPTSGAESTVKTVPSKQKVPDVPAEPPAPEVAEKPKPKRQPKKKVTPADPTTETAKKAKGKAFDPKFAAQEAPEPTWANHAKLMEHFQLSEAEATAVLLDVCGPDPSGKKFWKGFKKQPNPDTVETQEIPQVVQDPPKAHQFAEPKDEVPDGSELDGVRFDEDIENELNGFDDDAAMDSESEVPTHPAPELPKSTVQGVATPQVRFPKRCTVNHIVDLN